MNQALTALTALAHATRLAIFRHLVAMGPEGDAAGRIATALGVPASSLSFHLKELAHADLVTARQQGRSIRYSARFETMGGLVAYLTENCCQGEPCGLPTAAPVCGATAPSAPATVGDVHAA